MAGFLQMTTKDTSIIVLSVLPNDLVALLQKRNRLFGVFVDPNRELRTKDQNASAAHYRVVIVDMAHPGLLHIIAGLLAFCSILVVICTSLNLVLDM